MDKRWSSSISTGGVGGWTLLQIWGRWSSTAHILRWDYMLAMRIPWTDVLVLWRILAWMLVVRGLGLLLSTRIIPRVGRTVTIPLGMELLLRGLHSGPWASIALLHEHVGMIIGQIGLLLWRWKCRWHMVRSAFTACAAKLWLHCSLMIVHCHSLMITRATMVEILLSLSLLVLLVACLALTLSILFRKWWSSLTCFTAEFSGFSWRRFSNWILRLILFADYILTITV